MHDFQSDALGRAVPYGVYTTGQTVSAAEMATLNLERHNVCPTWNYTIRPRSDPVLTPIRPCQTRKLLFSESLVHSSRSPLPGGRR